MTSFESTAAVKERPILFSGPMVKAILDGRKTQTRRVVKDDRMPTVYPGGGEKQAVPEWYFEMCPYGKPGERLWVQETFCDRADYAEIAKLRSDRYHYAADGRKSGWKYRPSIHMPRAASRITLEIVRVRVERLQDISAKDILAEGVVERSHECQHLGKCPISAFDQACYPDLMSLWAAGWEKINGKGSWDANPWVWTIEFKRI